MSLRPGWGPARAARAARAQGAGGGGGRKWGFTLMDACGQELRGQRSARSGSGSSGPARDRRICFVSPRPAFTRDESPWGRTKEVGRSHLHEKRRPGRHEERPPRSAAQGPIHPCAPWLPFRRILAPCQSSPLPQPLPSRPLPPPRGTRTPPPPPSAPPAASPERALAAVAYVEEPVAVLVGGEDLRAGRRESCADELAGRGVGGADKVKRSAPRWDSPPSSGTTSGAGRCRRRRREPFPRAARASCAARRRTARG